MSLHRFTAKDLKIKSSQFLLSLIVVLSYSQLFAFQMTGEGHYGLRPGYEQARAGDKSKGRYQASEQSFRLMAEFRSSDRASFFSELRIFPNNGTAYLGDTAQSKYCHKTSEADCQTGVQNVRDPGYQPLQATFSQAYLQYALDQAIIKVGRRSRSLGLGLLYDDGSKAFSRSASIFDGIEFNINILENQTLGFSLGFDRLAETVQSIKDPTLSKGATAKGDLDQFYLQITYDDRKVNMLSPLTKKISFYVSKIRSTSFDNGGNNTDLNFVDLFTGMYKKSLSWENEILLTLGKTGDPNARLWGGATESSDGSKTAINKMNNIALSGKLAWTLAQSGSYNGPEELRQGNAKSHSLLLEYSLSPGDSSGYYNEEQSENKSPLHISKRTENSKARAFPFHENYKPTLILFNPRGDLSELNIDGVFNADRLMNAQVYSLGYRYDELGFGLFETKLSYAFLSEKMPQDVKQYYQENPDQQVIGFYGNNLGVELDLHFKKHLRHDFITGLSVGVLFPGDAWKTAHNKSLSNTYRIEGSLVFNI